MPNCRNCYFDCDNIQENLQVCHLTHDENGLCDTCTLCCICSNEQCGNIFSRAIYCKKCIAREQYPTTLKNLELVNNQGWVCPGPKLYLLIQRVEQINSFKSSKSFEFLSEQGKIEIIYERAEIIKELRGFGYKCFNCGTSHNITKMFTNQNKIISFCCDKDECIENYSSTFIPLVGRVV